jgi:hypothetical protein
MSDLGTDVSIPDGRRIAGARPFEESVRATALFVAVADESRIDEDPIFANRSSPLSLLARDEPGRSERLWPQMNADPTTGQLLPTAGPVKKNLGYTPGTLPGAGADLLE